MKPTQMAKKQRLEDSAIRLFLEKGIVETSVNDIVKAANLAKGTFYVYYKDKAALTYDIIVKKNLVLMDQLIKKAKTIHEQSRVPWIHIFHELLMRSFQQDASVLKLIHYAFISEDKKPFPTALLRDEISCFDEFIASFQRKDEMIEDTRKRFCILVETTVIVCYNAVFHQHPDSIDHIMELYHQMMCDCFQNPKEEAL